MRKNGFTLVELLVVIMILSVLMAVLLPNVVGGGHEAKTLACAKTLINLYGTLVSYAQDYPMGGYPYKDDGGEPAITDGQSFWKRLIDAGKINAEGGDVNKAAALKCAHNPTKLGFGGPSGNINDTIEYTDEDPIAGDLVDGTKSSHGEVDKKPINFLQRSGGVSKLTNKDATKWSNFTTKVIK